MKPASQADAHGGAPSVRADGGLALCFEEAFTVTVRLRANRQVASDAGAFRRHLKRLLADADRTAREAGYDPGQVRLATYAFVAFLDESVLNSSQEIFADWTRRPLQEEVFGDHRAGETFFENLRELLSRPDSRALADVLEIYVLCLLLGFRGRYGSDQAGELHTLVSRAREKIGRVRGEGTGLAPSWAPAGDEDAPSRSDPWVRRLGLAAAGTLGVTVLLFLLYTLLLSPAVDDVRTAAERVVG